MARILLPLAIVAAIFFGPMYGFEADDPIRGEQKTTVSGEAFIGNAVGCLLAFKMPVGEECESDFEIDDSKTVGQVITWASLLALAAAVLGVIGLIPVIGRITSVVTILAGLGALGAMGLLALTLIGSDVGLPGLGWGAYLAAGAGLLTLISGLAGLRGR